jgi:2-polyprenyl-6-methoxyphenol hydroxylase-like FAD-dependent oxidoreductase
MLTKPRSLLIVGGGTAGWMTANSLLQAWPETYITLVESADIGIIGVGEGATPFLKQYFRELGIPESEWMPACDATYKVGISFENWSGVATAPSYFHPFYSALDTPPADLFFHNCGLRRRGFDASANPNDYFVAAHLAKNNLSPIFSGNQPIDIDYAYHFDSVKLGQFLRDKAKQKGLIHVVDNVSDVQIANNGDIKQLICEKHGALSADFFIDCTGFSAHLIHKALKREYLSYADTLFNDAAVAIQTPYAQDLKTQVQRANTYTRSIALSSGWMWNIPLRSRQGNGYVYSQTHISADQAETELRQKLQLEDNADVSAKHLKMRIGRLKEHWHANCLAVGLSQGFIEPLEATALMLTQLTVERFVACFTSQKNTTSTLKNKFNQQLNTTFDGIRDYVVAHYQLTQREDTAYWLDNKYNKVTPHILSVIVQAWDDGQDVEQVLHQYKQELVYLRPSWYCILAGMGRFPTDLKLTSKAADVQQAIHYCQKIAKQHFS